MSTDFDPSFSPILARCQSATMTSTERLYALYKAARYLSDAAIAGDVVECGVWKGGSMMCAALAFAEQKDFSRQLYLYDTFEGMVAPDQHDVDLNGGSAEGYLATEDRSEASSIWAYAPIDVVRSNIESTDYPGSKVTYVKGPVEETIPGTMPDKIALLRLDTDWYSSTRHELEHLFPRLVKGGVLIIDDYGHWQGARKAVDEYFESSPVKVLLNRIDYTGRVAVKA